MFLCQIFAQTVYNQSTSIILYVDSIAVIVERLLMVQKDVSSIPASGELFFPFFAPIFFFGLRSL